MLILSRFPSEEVIIGEGEDQVVMTVVEVRGDKVRLGFEAAEHVVIHRREVFESIQRDIQQGQRTNGHKRTKSD